MSIKLNAVLPKGYEARTMFLYVAKTRNKWGFMFSDGKGYSVPALFDNDVGSGPITMLDHFTTRSNATHWAKINGWTVYPCRGRNLAPNFRLCSDVEPYNATTRRIALPRD